MRRFTLIFSLALLLTAAPPASGQDAPPPEATPEFWPLTFDPSTVIADPDTFTLIFEATARCTLVPAHSAVLLRGVGAYDLATGAKLSDVTGSIDALSPAAPLVHLRGDGLYNYRTGERLIETAYDRGALFSPDGRWFVDYKVVYDLETLAPVAEIDRSGDSVMNWSYAAFTEDGRHLRALADRYVVTYDTSTWQPIHDLESYERLALRDGAVLLNEATVWVAGDGVYDLMTGEKRFDQPDAEMLQASPDGVLLAAAHADEIVVYRTSDGSVVQRLAAAGARQIVFSMDNRALIVQEYSEVRSGGRTRFIQQAAHIYDLESGEHRMTIAPVEGDSWFLRDSRYVAVRAQGVYDTHAGALVASMTDDEQYIVMSSDSDLVFMTSDAETVVIDAGTWATRLVARGRPTSISPDERWLATSHGDVYDTVTGELALVTQAGGLEFTADGALLTGIARDRCAIYRLPEG